MGHYAKLDEAGKAVVRAILDAMVESVNEYAGMMERGEIPMLPGPEALRQFAATANVAMIMKEIDEEPV